MAAVDNTLDRDVGHLRIALNMVQLGAERTSAERRERRGYQENGQSSLLKACIEIEEGYGRLMGMARWRR
jgi:hypothetical protein